MPEPRIPTHVLALTLTFAVLASVTPLAVAHTGIGGGVDEGGRYVPPPPSAETTFPRGERPCDNRAADWRPAQTVEGVPLEESLQCRPDNPKLVAAFVKGTNNVPADLLDEVALHADAVVKDDDRDGDGDPDVIRITLEVAEINGWHLTSDLLTGSGYAIAPGVKPGFWVFTPKSTIHHGGPYDDIARMPTAPIRVEQGDEVHLTLENTHYFPHTLHLHGVDHPFITPGGEGNDGVPHVSENPVLPGEKKTYVFTARQPGSMFVHCHVHPHVHVGMGLATLLIIEENRPDNLVQTFNPGAGHVRYPSQAVREEYDREYDLVYQDIDKELNDLVRASNDPRVVAKAMHRDYDTTERDPDYFLVNGRSYPYTLRESVVVVAENETVKLRIANAGTKPLSLHPHGHKPVATHVDGVELPEAARVQRDVHTLTAAQRLDLELRTTNDGLNAYGPGLWFMHDHQEESVTTDGIGPGGDITLIAYESHLDERTSFPVPLGAPLDIYFTEEYYRGEIPVFHHAGLHNFLGDVALPSTSTVGGGGGDGTGSRLTPGPAGVGALAAAAALLGLATRRWRP